MIKVDIERGSAPDATEGIAPTHKITVKYGAKTSVFWYLQHCDTRSSLSDPQLGYGILKRLHNAAQDLMVGDFAYLFYGKDGDYRLQRLASDRFALTPLA